MVVHRPPPLQLKYDNFRLLSIAQSPAIVRRKKSFFQHLYRASWRKVVIAAAAFNTIRFFLSSSNAFQDAVVDYVDHHDGLAQMSLIICLLYILVASIETFGIVCTWTARLTLVRAYTYLAFASALSATAAGIMRAVIFFGFSHEIIDECTSLATQGRLHLRSTFQGHPWPIKRLGGKKAYKLCVAAWTHESSFQAVSVFACTLLPTVICLFFVYTYYRQTTDPNHKACLLSAVPRTGRGGIQLEGGNRGSYASVAIASARQDSQALRPSSQRRRVVPGQAREAKGLHKQKQPRKCEAFTTSQRKRLANASNGQTSTLNMTEVGLSQPMQAHSVRRSTTSPYKITPGPPSYAGDRVVRGYEAYGPRMDADIGRLD